MVEQTKVTTAAWPADAIRLDAYDHPAGAGTFYTRCGFLHVGQASTVACRCCTSNTSSLPRALTPGVDAGR
jgi:hypothetical protein